MPPVMFTNVHLHHVLGYLRCYIPLALHHDHRSLPSLLKSLCPEDLQPTRVVMLYTMCVHEREGNACQNHHLRPCPELIMVSIRSCALWTPYSGGTYIEFGVLATVACTAGPSAADSGVAGTGVT